MWDGVDADVGGGYEKTIQANIFNIPLYGPETMKHLVKKIRLN